jgi:phage gpG-like protein
MSLQIKPQLTPEAQRVVDQLREMPERMGREIARVMDRENEITVGHISERYLSRRGPRSLGVRTNRLRSSLRRSKARISGALGVVSSIGTNVEYMGVHEFGFSGTVSVKSHTRRQSHVFGRALAQPIVSTVKAHDRQVDIPERAPIRRGIRDRMDDYVRSISNAITDTR